ncbi:hypothetical protein L3Q82_001370 [Scortum barcoo]|uniref:Uncharacterized protein n=1 Tax=Scortum barcoo TaxID=214431 RepID=A0ACB8WAE0_9TELE|nr:hypothetical protein L3Q82_001370 [Scortum barcoo]
MSLSSGHHPESSGRAAKPGARGLSEMSAGPKSKIMERLSHLGGVHPQRPPHCGHRLQIPAAALPHERGRDDGAFSSCLGEKMQEELGRCAADAPLANQLAGVFLDIFNLSLYRILPCTPHHRVKFADDTTILDLILDNDETHYREEIQHLTQWRTEHAPLLIHGEAVERVNNIKFLGIHITFDLTWSMNTAHLVKKAQQRLFFLRKAETCWTLPSAPDKLLQGHNREHPLPSLVGQLHCTRPKRLSPGGENGTGDCGKSSSRPGLNIRWPDAEEGPTYCHAETHPPGQWTLFVPLPSGKRRNEDHIVSSKKVSVVTAPSSYPVTVTNKWGCLDLDCNLDPC